MEELASPARVPGEVRDPIAIGSSCEVDLPFSVLHGLLDDAVRQQPAMERDRELARRPVIDGAGEPDCVLDGRLLDQPLREPIGVAGAQDDAAHPSGPAALDEVHEIVVLEGDPLTASAEQQQGAAFGWLDIRADQIPCTIDGFDATGAVACEVEDQSLSVEP